MDQIEVLFLWMPDEALKQHIIEQLEGLSIHLIFPEEKDNEIITQKASNATIIVGWRPTIELLNSAKKLKLFINPGAGVQHLIEMFRHLGSERKVTLVNGHGNAYFTAQHIMAMLLSAANQLFPHHNWMLEGRWRTGDKEVKSIPLRSRKIGLLGYGNVNRTVQRFLNAFEPEISVLRKHGRYYGSDGLQVHKWYGPEELHDFLRAVNVVIITLPLTSETRGMIGAEELALLGSDGFLVHAGRGPVVDEEALFNALKDRTIAAAAIDVWYNYRPEPDEQGRRYPYKYPFHELDNVGLSPHRAASPFDDLDRWDDVIENIKRCANGRTDYLNVVDLEEGY